MFAVSAPPHDFARMMAPVAIEILGEPNKTLSNKVELRWGSRGALSVNIAKGTWCDHSDGDCGGGVLDLLKSKKDLDKPDAVEWLRVHKYLPPAGANGHAKPKIVATYDYTDADGDLLFQVCRLEPKDFRQRQPDGNGWLWKMDGVERVIYRLPSVIAAVSAGRTVYVAEGEKGVHAIETLGLVGTCSPAGAGKWHARYNPVFAGADVVILPDNDPQATKPDGTPLWHPDGRPVLPGQDHAADVASHLLGVAERVRVLPLPGLPLKGDVADWVAADGTAAKLEELAALVDVERPLPNGKDNYGPGEDQSPEPPPHAGRTRGRTEDPGEFVWPQPLDFLTEPNSEAPELHAEHIPEAVNDFVFDTAQRMGADPTSVALAAIVACASVASDDWKVQPKRHDATWTENARPWGAVLGSPSIKKTPVIMACTKPIDALDAAGRRRHAEAMRIYKAAVKAAKADKTGETPEPTHPRLDRYLVENTTTEALSEILREDDGARQRAPGRKVLVRQDEMSEFFANLDRYRAGGNGGGDRGAYLRLYNGGPYSTDRIGRGSFSVPNWSATFLGGMQPGPIQNIAKNATEDGLLQRFLYVVPGPQKPGADRKQWAEAQGRYEALFPALAGMHPPRTPDGKHIQVVVFHADAHQHREAVDTMAEVMALMPDTSPHLLSAYGKWPGLFARVALSFHLIELADAKAAGSESPYPLVISEQTARRAGAFMLEIALPHLLRAHMLMFSTTQTGHARWIAGYILAERFERITSRDLVRVYSPLKAPEAKTELGEVMASLVTVGWLEPEPPTNAAKPVHAWRVNPAVHVLFAQRAEQEQERRRKARERVAAVFGAEKPEQAEADPL
jgi:hypothetical protein